MARYIDADALIKQMKDVDRERSFQRGVNLATDYWITEINHFPTADVVPKSEVENINLIQEAIEQKKKENKESALGVLNELLDEKDAEIKRLKYTLTGVMHSVDKWLDGEELKQDEVNRAITMREKTLRIVEQYQEKLEDYKYCWYKIHDSYNADCRESYNIGRQEVAREIFEDIRNTCGYSVAEHDGVVLYHTKCYSIMATKLDELEKKYTESEDEG